MNSDPLYEQAIRDVARLESDNVMLRDRVRELEAKLHLVINKLAHAEQGWDRAEAKVGRLREAIVIMRGLLQKHWSDNPAWRKGNEHLWMGQADIVAEDALAASGEAEEKHEEITETH